MQEWRECFLRFKPGMTPLQDVEKDPLPVLSLAVYTRTRTFIVGYTCCPNTRQLAQTNHHAPFGPFAWAWGQLAPI